MVDACGILIAVNGSETDVDVENDSAPWVEKIGNVKIKSGGGSWWRNAQPGVCNFDALIPVNLAPLIRTITVAVTLEASTASTLPTGVVAGSPPYRIVFHGDVQTLKEDQEGIVKLDASSEMSGLLSRRARLAAESAANTPGIRETTAEIEAAHSLSIGGNNDFPSDSSPGDATAFPLVQRPRQKTHSNGELLRKILAPYGINVAEAWDGTLTAPTLRWRADYQDPTVWSATTTNHWAWECGYPWEMTYTDVGIQWQDFVARIVMTGEAWDDSSVACWAYAQLSNAGPRNRCGQREIVIPTLVSDGTDLEDACLYMLGRQGEPGWMKMNAVTVNVEHYYRVLSTRGAVDAEIEALYFAACMLGDRMAARNAGGGAPFANSHPDYGNWPSGSVSGTYYNKLKSLWMVELANDGNTADVDEWVIRSLTREWDPNGGWTVTYGFDPYQRLAPGDFAGADSDNGTGNY